MHISAMEEYGLRCALQLARAEGQGPLSASQIAEREGISVEYVSKFMHFFKKATLVKASRGVQGGFALAQPASQVSLKAVFDALKGRKGEELTAAESPSVDSFCGQFAGRNDTCVHINQCSVRPFWSVLSYYFDEVTRSLTLGDLLRRETEARAHVESVVGDKVKKLKEELR